MSIPDDTRIIYRRTPESAAMLANVKRAMAITARLNRLSFDDADEIRALFSELIGKKVDESFLLIPPFYTAGGDEIRVGRNVFVNQNCTFYDLGGLHIADDVLIGPNVSIITEGHPLAPSERRAATTGAAHSFDWPLDWRLMLLHDFENLVAQKRNAAGHDYPDFAGGCAVRNDGRDFVR
jgi:hypothetical protein